jgi:hypothetical protein
MKPMNRSDKRSLPQAGAGATALTVGGHDDWRLPTIKELYSLIDFTGTDPAPTVYADTSSETKMFGVNFADGRIKGYGLGPFYAKAFFVRYVRGSLAYGVNDFHDNGDGTITDKATTLMWSRADSGAGMDWVKALAWVQAKNAENYLGHDDWRLPDIKELQSLVDYARSPGTSGSAAIDPLFASAKSANEAGDEDYPCYWSSTTHLSAAEGRPGMRAAYVAFGQAMGKMGGVWSDVHGAGCQRSDPKQGNAADYPDGFGPQGDAIRIDNFTRLVRDTE